VPSWDDEKLDGAGDVDMELEGLGFNALGRRAGT